MDISIGFLSAGDARDPRTWSGTQYFMAQALAARVRELHYFGPMPTPYSSLRERTNRIRRAFGLPLKAPGLTFKDAAAHDARIKAQLARTPCDVLFAPAGAALIASYSGDVPMVYNSDTTFQLMRFYYPSFSVLSDEAAREGDQIETRALQNSDLIVMPSRWAALSVTGDYGIDTGKVFVTPYGVNMHPVATREQALRDRTGPLNLLFVGVNWERKGGPIFMDALAHLRGMGVPVTATIVGCVPPADVECTGIEVIPYLDKNKPQDAARLTQLYLEADFLLVPSRQECFGMVYPEAAAHGATPVGTETGGVAEVVRRGETGLLLGPMAKGAQFAETIMQNSIPRDGGRGAPPKMRAAARADYESRLNWDAWADQMLDLIKCHILDKRV